MSMKTLLEIKETQSNKAFQQWRDSFIERVVPVELSKIGESPFHGAVEASFIGTLPVTRLTQSGVRVEATSRTVRRHSKNDTFTACILEEGILKNIQYDRSGVQKAGEIVIYDRRPQTVVSEDKSRALLIEIPRERIEGIVGPSQVYSSLTIDTTVASTAIVSTFFRQLLQINDLLSPQASTQMSSIGVDLIVACLAERMAKDLPHRLHGTLVVQRAKLSIESNLGNPKLSPAYLALTVGISLRQLQSLFQERGLGVSELIWERRLQVAAQRLSDPLIIYENIGTIANISGFISQSHFTRKFKERYGYSPREYRKLKASALR